MIQSFRDLRVYQKAREETRRIYQISKLFPKEEQYSLTDQIRRSSRAVSAILAEGWGRRHYPAAFTNKMDEAPSEAMETQAWLGHALDCGYVTAPVFQEMDQVWQNIGGMLNRMIERTDAFCASAKRQSP